jgi:predicted Na+-dependent transporter
MSNLSAWNWFFICLGVIFLISDILLSRAVVKSGVPRWWAVLFLFPVVNIVLLWLFACGKGPELHEQ